MSEGRTARGGWRAILDPLQVGPLRLRNRLAFGPHCPVFVDRDGAGVPGEQFAAYMAERAAGGAGLVIVGVSAVDPTALHYPISVPALYDDAVVPGLRMMADAVHAHDSLLLVQLSHPGLHGDPRWQRDPTVGAGLPGPLPLAPVAPSALPAPASPGVVARELTELEIHALIDAFAESAARTAAACADGVEVQAAVGFLIEQFLSPLSNHRTDRWGGDLRGRARFLLEVVARVREAIGPQRAIGVRLTLDQMLPGGYGLDEAKRIVALLEEQGTYDYLNPCLGSFYLPHLHVASLYRPPAFEKEMVAELRAAATRPVFLSNRIVSIEHAGQLVAEGYADAINMVRQLIADPDTLVKAQAGEPEEIRGCISCNQWCIGNVYQGLRVSCVVNPRAGREAFVPERLVAGAPRRVLVVGGGPAGLKLAERATEAGHVVTLVEAGDELGGAVRLAARLPGREAVIEAVDHLARRLRRLDVEVLAGTRVDAGDVLERVQAEGFTDVVVATGARRDTGGWSGATGAEVAGLDARLTLAVDDLLAGERPPAGSSVLVADEPGDAIGVGLAELLAREGFAVELVTRWPVPGQQLAAWGFVPEILPRLHEAGVRLSTDRMVVALSAAGATVLNPYDGTTEERAVDAVVLVGAPRTRGELAAALGAGACPAALHVIGDAAVPRSIGEAILEAEGLAARLCR